MTKTARIRLGCNTDRSFLDDLQKRYSGHLGFLPKPALDWYLEHRCVTVALQNGQPAGYLLGREKLRCAPHIAPIFQAAVAMDAQRRHHGLSLVLKLATEARKRRQSLVQCWCAEDLEANDFWKAAGFIHTATRSPENARDRRLLLWRLPLIQIGRQVLYEPPKAAGHQAALLDRPLTSLLTSNGRLKGTADVITPEEYELLHGRS